MKFQSRYGLLMFLVLLLASAMNAIAQPSGGPYGPIREKYSPPKVSGTIYYVAVDGKADQSGESIEKPTTLETAIGRVKTGDAIVMRGGIYRTGNLLLNQGVTIQPYEVEEPILRGTLVADQWRNMGGGLWVTKWSHLFPSKPDAWWQRSWEERFTPLYRFNNDMVFVNGRFLQSVGWPGEVNENTYCINYEDSLVYIGVDPTNKLVEITAHDVAILRTTKECNGKVSDHKGYTIRGVTFTQYAYRALEIEGTEPAGLTDESKFGTDVVGSTLENCTITYCSRVAGYFRGNHLTFRHCKISDTSTEGVYIIGSNDVLLEGNIFQRNNIENITGYYPAAVKIFNQCHRVTCRDNLVTDLPNSNGIWYDVGEVDGVFVDNWVQNVGHVDTTMPTNQLWPSQNGFFFEISKGVTVAGNVFVNCDHGMMILNSSNAQIYNNTFVNSVACIGRNGRVPAGDRFGWHSSTGPDVDKREGHVFVNNVLTGDENFNRPLLFVWQPASMCQKTPNPQLKEFDYNVFVRGIAKASYPLILWSPAANEQCQAGFADLADMQKALPEFGKHGAYYGNYGGPLFKGGMLGNYQIVSAFPGLNLGTKIPSQIAKEIAGPRKVSTYIGAYPTTE